VAGDILTEPKVHATGATTATDSIARIRLLLFKHSISLANVVCPLKRDFGKRGHGWRRRICDIVVDAETDAARRFNVVMLSARPEAQKESTAQLKERTMKFYAHEYKGQLEVFSFDGVYRIRITRLCGAAKEAFADTVQLWISDGVSADEAIAREAESLARLIKEY